MWSFQVELKEKIVKLILQVSEVTYSVSGNPETVWSVGDATALSSQAPVVTVSRTGLVTSHSALGSASVLIHSTEDYGLKQTLPVNVEVLITSIGMSFGKQFGCNLLFDV